MAQDSGGRVACGRVAGAHGVRGWLRIRSDTRPPDNLLRYPRWQLRGGGGRRDLPLERGRRQGRRLLAKLAGIDDRDAAAALAGREIWIEAAAFAPLPPGEYYHHQLLGLAAVDQRGAPLGRVARILETGAHDVLLIAGAEERLVPYVPGATVLAVELGAGRIRVRWDGVAG